MGLFRRSPKQAKAVRDWATGPVVKHSHVADEAPDVLAFALGAIEEAGRTEQADPQKVLMALDNILSDSMDAFASRHGSGFGPQQLAGMRDALRRRPDFRYEMYFDGLTYFGASGIAMSSVLAEHLDNHRAALVQFLAEGRFDRS